jgi:hypothetical protein
MIPSSRWLLLLPMMMLMLLSDCVVLCTWIQLQQPVPAVNFGGEALSVQPTVTLWTAQGTLDAFGRVIPTQVAYDSVVTDVPVNASLVDASGADMHMYLLGTTRIVSSCGTSRFTDIAITRIGTYKFIFSAVYLRGDSLATRNETTMFQVVHGSAYRLEVTTQPRGFRAQRTFQVQPVVAVHDRGGNIVTSGPGSVAEITVGISGIATIYNEQTYVQAKQGVAQFASVPCTRCTLTEPLGLAVSARASSIRLVFSSPQTISAETSAFDVSDWPPQVCVCVVLCVRASVCCVCCVLCVVCARKCVLCVRVCDCVGVRVI